jgi:glycosyltransferase involved in cell wall biosynthesis
MIIGIEAERANHPQKTGVEHYAKQVILHLAQIDRQNSYVLYLRSEPQAWFFPLPKNFIVKVIPFSFFWTQLRISWEMLIHPVDVLFIPASALPIIHPKKSVVTIHDLAWNFYPETFTWFNRSFLQLSTWFAVKFAYKIIAVSEATKKDLIKEYKTNSGKIAVIHHGYEIGPSSVNGPASAKALAGKQLSNVLPPAYILFLSTLQPRKNLEGLIKAFRLLKQELPELPQKLVVVGKPGWKFEPIFKDINDNKDIVVYMNHVSEQDKFAILSGAEVLVLPSFYEGFGMQILEAFAANVPVATSNISSMPEVAGEAAVYFNPNNITEIKNAIKNILLDKSLADRLRDKGKERLKEFSWEKCAKETLEILVKS